MDRHVRRYTMRCILLSMPLYCLSAWLVYEAARTAMSGQTAGGWGVPLLIFLSLAAGNLAWLLGSVLRCIEADDRYIYIRSYLRSVRISLHDVIETGHFTREDIAETDLRVFRYCSDRWSRYRGEFSNKRFGTICLYATELDNLVYIRTRGRVYVVSCTAAHEFMDHVSMRMG